MTRPDRAVDESFFFDRAVETLERLAPHFQIVLTRQGALDHMRLEVEAAADTPTDDDSLAKRSKSVQRHIKSMVGVTCDVTVKRPGETLGFETPAERFNACVASID